MDGRRLTQVAQSGSRQAEQRTRSTDKLHGAKRCHKGNVAQPCAQIFEHLDCDLHVYAGKQRPMPSDSIRVREKRDGCLKRWWDAERLEDHVSHTVGIASLPLGWTDASRSQATQHFARHIR